MNRQGQTFTLAKSLQRGERVIPEGTAGQVIRSICGGNEWQHFVRLEWGDNPTMWLYPDDMQFEEGEADEHISS